jgi:ribosomal protein L16/L10AE
MTKSSIALVGMLLVVCTVTAAVSAACPTVAVIIPETVIIDRIPRPIPDPAAETALIGKLLAYHFNVVDLAHVGVLRASTTGLQQTNDLAKRAIAGDGIAIRELAARSGGTVDVLVVGEAVSTVTVFEALQVPGQARVQDGRARIEVRAIEVKTGRILASASLHTGGVDFSAALAGKKSLERAGDKIACSVATAIARAYPFSSQCFAKCTPPSPTFGVLSFAIQAPVHVRNVDLGQVFATATETALSERGCRTAKALAADYVFTGTVSDWKEISTGSIEIPFLSLFFRAIACQVTVDAQVLDLNTAEFDACEVTVEVAGVEIFGFRFGVSPRDIARAVARDIAARLGRSCGGK